MSNTCIKQLVIFLVFALGLPAPAWSALFTLPQENTLDPSYYNFTHMPRIDMANVDLAFKAGGNLDGKFIATSSGATTLTLISPNGSSTGFSGSFRLKAKIAADGTFRSGSFAFSSSDSMFGFGGDTGIVFGGSLTGFGWSAAHGFLEFSTGSFSGWVCDQGWCTRGERLWFNTLDGTLGLVTNNSNHLSTWSAKANGTAVIPTPGAAWLFGSGLLGLFGASRKARCQSS